MRRLEKTFVYKEPPPSAKTGGGGGVSAAAAVSSPRATDTAARTSIRQPSSGWVSSVSQSAFLLAISDKTTAKNGLRDMPHVGRHEVRAACITTGQLRQPAVAHIPVQCCSSALEHVTSVIERAGMQDLSTSAR